MPATGTNLCSRRRTSSRSRALHVIDAWVVVCYRDGEALANFIQLFWMIAVLGIKGVHPRRLVEFALTTLCVMALARFIISIVLA